MTDDEQRDFAEATFLDVIRGEMGEFKVSIELRDGRYLVRLAVPKELPSMAVEGDSFAEAWLTMHRAGEGQRARFGVIKGGKDR